MGHSKMCTCPRGARAVLAVREHGSIEKGLLQFGSKFYHLAFFSFLLRMSRKAMRDQRMALFSDSVFWARAACAHTQPGRRLCAVAMPP